MSDDFKNLVAASPSLLERWTTLSESMIEEAAEAGIPITKSDLATLSGVKIAVISGDLDYVKDWQAQARLSIPAFKAAQEVRDLKDALASEDVVAQATGVEGIEKLSPNERMNLGRTIGKSTKVAPPPALNASERAHHVKIAQSLRAGARLAYSRKWGLG